MNPQSILIVDDNPDNLAVLEQLLNQAGYLIRAADSGKMALASLQRELVDLILLDIVMPNMDGYAVCQQLKNHPATQNIPVIFLSALNDPQDKIKAFERGGVDYIAKPFNDLEVLARVKTHLQLYDLQRHLETEVAQRTRDLRAANAGLEKALQAKKDFLSLMGHEFRTPLNGILGMAEFLKSSASAEQRGCIEIIENSGWRLLKLVKDILQATKQGISEEEAESRNHSLDVEQLCATSLRSIAQLAAEKNIQTQLTLEKLPPLHLNIDAERLTQIVGNLLDNAVKYTPDQGHLGIDLNYLDEVQQLIIEVWDTGPGIAPNDRHKIFEPFAQLEPLLSRKYEGAGLGLTLARNLARLHGGDIDISSKEHGGSVFRVCLPAIEN